MTTSSRLSSSSTRLHKLARTLVLISAATGLVGLSHSASTAQVSQSPQSNHNTLTSQQWREKKLDEYLRTYPKGNVLSLPEYAQQLSHPFSLQCGIGKMGHCQPPPDADRSLRESPDWWIITSTFIWNYYTNFLAVSLSLSGKSARSVVHRLLHDLVHDFKPESSLNVITEIDMIRMIILAINPGVNRDPTINNGTGTLDWLPAISPLATNANSLMDWSQVYQTVTSINSYRPSRSRPGAPITNGPLIMYNSSLPVETNLWELSVQMEYLLQQSVENKVNSPISLDTGIFSALAGGRFAVSPGLPDVWDNGQHVQALIAISAILNNQNSMILIRKSSCSQYVEEMNKHGHDRLHFCDSNTLLVEIVNVRENTIINDIYNAHLIESKYGFSTPFLLSEALRCQRATQQIGQESTRDPKDPFDVCTFQLPICNLQDGFIPGLQGLLSEGKSIVEICRENVGLPI